MLNVSTSVYRFGEEENDPEHREMRKRFELKEQDGSTILRLTHRELHSFPDHPDFAKGSSNGGWTELIGTLLKNFVEA